MTEAIFGLIGVLIGGLLNGGISYVSSRGARSREAKMASRLIYDEMLESAVAFDLARRENKYRMINSLSPHQFWDKHHELLAETLSDPEWEAVSGYYFWIDRARMAAEEDEDPIDDEAGVLGVQEYRDEALEAIRARAGVERKLLDDLEEKPT